MRFSVLLKFVLGYVLFAALSITVITLYTYRSTYDNTLETAAAKLRQTAQTLAEEFSSIYIESDEVDRVYQNRLELIAGFEDFELWVIDVTGAVRCDSSSALIGRKLDFSGLMLDTSYYTTGTLNGIFDEEQLIVTSYLTADYSVFGYIFIIEPLSEIEATANTLTRPAYNAFFIIFLISLLILAMVYFVVHKPIQKITQAARDYADGNLDHQITITSHDEFGYLAETLNGMAQELAHAGEYQRSFISNISHDLRSPLTSIKGYANAMLDGTIPEDSREKYLQIVVNEAERLQGLTQNVLQLNSVDKYSMNIDPEDFDIAALIRDSCASFEGRCAEREISFELMFEAAEMHVNADRTKLQQVIYNLTDNAVKFSPDGSVITIEVFYRRDKAFVSVRDQGIGISKESVKKIWNRFYKGDESRGKDKKGTGLGLAIVKEIISAHGENIDVISTEGVGTEFIFSIQRSDD